MTVLPQRPASAAIEVLGRQITAALGALRSARRAANAERSGYRANQELMAQVEMDNLVERWPTRRLL